jgi:hypothetical protein
MMSDARKHPRYPAKRGILALLSIPRGIAARIGELVDLSEGGLEFDPSLREAAERLRAFVAANAKSSD